MPKLGINIDHIATLRQLRRASYPDVILAAKICESAGADSIVVHLREDRRHIQDSDLYALRKTVTTKLNMEMSIAKEIVAIACRVKPNQSTLVPEKRRELTTEGGLDCFNLAGRVQRAVSLLKKNGIAVSLFIEPLRRQIKMAKELGADCVELHTGEYANSIKRKDFSRNLSKIRDAVLYARQLGLVVNAGHGLDYENVCAVVNLGNIYELNIGYSIICQSVFVGLDAAVRQMKKLLTI